MRFNINDPFSPVTCPSIRLSSGGGHKLYIIFLCTHCTALHSRRKPYFRAYHWQRDKNCRDCQKLRTCESIHWKVIPCGRPLANYILFQCINTRWMVFFSDMTESTHPFLQWGSKESGGGGVYANMQMKIQWTECTNLLSVNWSRISEQKE